MNEEAYTFDEQKKFGDEGEKLFREWIAKTYPDSTLVKTDISVDKTGVDFFMDGIPIDVKYDRQGHVTGNVFIELISVDKSRTGVNPERWGWVWTTKADIIVYIVPGCSKVFWIRTKLLRRAVEILRRKYELRECRNRDYSSWGMTISFSDMEVISKVREFS